MRRFYGQALGGPPLDRYLYERYFESVEGGVSIECGACDGKLENTTLFFERFRGWECINIEPVPFLFERLSINRPDSTNLKIALSDKSGTATFTHAVHPSMGRLFGNGSLSHLKTHRDSLVREGCTFEEYEVETRLYKDVIADLGLTRLDLFVLDVEGHEISVLKGMHGAPLMPQVFCVEHGHLGVKALRDLIEPMGYRFDGTLAHNSFYVKT